MNGIRTSKDSILLMEKRPAECFEEAYKLEPEILEMMAQKRNDLNNI